MVFDALDSQSDRVLPAEFYAREPHQLARELLGRDLCVESEAAGLLRGRIVEVEVYGFVPDPASHSYRGVKTKRNRAMFGSPGNAYIYLIYGIYHCFNVVAQRGERPSAILVRAMHPLNGLGVMARRRGLESYTDKPASDKASTPEQMPRSVQKKLLSGPGKICQAMQIDLSCDEHRLWAPPLCICEGAPQAVRDEMEIISGARVGLNPETVGESCNWPWRYGVAGSRFLSRRID